MGTRVVWARCDPHLLSIVHKKALAKWLSFCEVKKVANRLKHYNFLPLLIALLIAGMALYFLRDGETWECGVQDRRRMSSLYDDLLDQRSVQWFTLRVSLSGRVAASSRKGVTNTSVCNSFSRVLSKSANSRHVSSLLLSVLTPMSALLPMCKVLVSFLSSSALVSQWCASFSHSAFRAYPLKSGMPFVKAGRRYYLF